MTPFRYFQRAKAYSAEWKEATWLSRHSDAGKTLSLRGTVGVTDAVLRRLKSLPQDQRPSIESYTTVRLHDLQVHTQQNPLLAL